MYKNYDVSIFVAGIFLEHSMNNIYTVIQCFCLLCFLSLDSTSYPSDWEATYFHGNAIKSKY